MTELLMKLDSKRNLVAFLVIVLIIESENIVKDLENAISGNVGSRRWMQLS